MSCDDTSPASGSPRSSAASATTRRSARRVHCKTGFHEPRGSAAALLTSCLAATRLQGFNQLFAYISGANSDSTSIAMTAPVTVQVVPGPGPTCGSNFSVSFFCASPPPPAPTSAQLFVRTVPAQDVYVSVYGGWADEKRVIQHARELADALASAGVDTVSLADGFTTAGYDSPFRVVDRHNEIWFVAPAPPDSAAAR